MVFLVGGANSASGDYEIDNSLRFNDGDSDYLCITPSSAGNRRTFTYSGWIKTDVATASSKALLSCGSDSGSNDYIMFQSGDKLRFSFGTEGNGDIITTRLFRDPAAWYHIVWAVDTTQGTAANRVKLYVNGTQASDVTGTYPDQNYDTSFNNTEVQRIGARAYSATQYYEGHMSEVYLIDGAQKAASDFGETDDNGVWIPKKYTGTYGTNGFKLEFKETGTSANASGMGADTSGNGNHLTPSNLTSTDVTTDTPQNNFCTLNTLTPTESNAGFSEGNLRFTNALNSSPHHALAAGTMAVAKGKWYWEVRVDAIGGTAMSIGAIEVSEFAKNDFTGDNGVGFFNNGNFHYRGTESSDPGTYTTNDIIGVALDMDNRKIWFHKNGTYEDSGDPTSGSTGTGAVSLNASDVTMAPAVSNYNSGICNVNFGNPAWSVSSTQADDDGYGNFEYDVPAGFYALCTKNLAEYG